MEERIKDKLHRRFESTKNLIAEIVPDITSTRFHKKSDYYSLFFTLYRLGKEGYKFKTEESKRNVRDVLVQLTIDIRKDTTNPGANLYFDAVRQGPDAQLNREIRYDFLRGLIEPLAIKTDPQRLFSDEQRKYIWHSKDDKVCEICGREVKAYDDYEPDHTILWSDGGPTSITNARITHKTCNRSRGTKK